MDTTNSLSTDSNSSQTLAESHSTPDELHENGGALAAVYEDEHPAVFGARVGACLFLSFVFPSMLWALGAATPGLACAVAATLTLLAARPVMLIGGPRIGRVVLLEIAISAVLLTRVMTPWMAIPLAVFLPLIGMLAMAGVGSRIAEQAFAELERPHEVEAAVARAMQSNVVDIRSAEAARRAGKKSRASTTGTSVTQSLQSQI